MSISSDAILFKLIRVALGNEDDFSLPNVVKWQDIIVLSYEQGVPAVAVDGLQRLCDSNRKIMIEMDDSVSEDVRYEWYGHAVLCELKYETQRKSIVELAKFYKNIGVPLLLLKGFGLSINYPTPSRRPVGDIDIYLFGKWKDADKSIAETYNIEIDHSHHHHTIFNFNGQTVENHYDIINTVAHEGAGRIDEILKQLALNSIVYTVDGVDILLPSPTFNAIFLIRHMGQHFAAEKIIVRHLLDWGLFLDKYSNEIDWHYVLLCWEEMRIENFAKVINTICKEYLGFNDEIFHNELICEDDPLVRRVINDILSPGEAGYNQGVIFKFRRWWRNIWKHRLVYGQPLIPMFITLAWSHMRKPTIT